MKEIIIRTSFVMTSAGCRSVIGIRRGQDTIRSLFYDFSGPVLPQKPMTDDFAVLAVFPFAMQRGANIRCEGRVSREQIERLEELQDAWALLHPDRFQKISVVADEEVELPKPANRDAVVAYSGGLDATFAVHAHRRGLLGRRQDNLRVAVMIHGFDIRLDRLAAFARAAEIGGNILKGYDVPLTTVRTNWRELRAPWEQSFMFGVASVLQQFSGTVSRGVIAADQAYAGEVLGWGSNSVTNPLVGNSGFPIDFTGAGYTRTNKARALRGEHSVLENLRVCYQNPDNAFNCGRCEKCVRTKLNFMVSGAASIPALGEWPTVSEVDRLIVDNPAAINLYRDLLENGDWSGHADLRSAVKRLVSPSDFDRRRQKVVKGAMGMRQRLNHFYRKHILQMSPGAW